MTERRRIAALAAALLIVVTACGGSDEASDELEVDGVWARPTAAVVDTGAVYMTLRSPVDDRLVSVAVDPAIAEAASLHETMTMTAASVTGTAAAGEDDMTTMSAVDAVTLPAGQDVAFEPGGNHVMVEHLVAPLTDGETFELTLGFEHAGERVVTVTVGDGAP